MAADQHQHIMVLLELEDVDDRAVFAGILVEFNNELQNAPAREVFPPGQRDDGFRRSYVMGPGKKPPRRQALFLEDEFGLPGAYGVRRYEVGRSADPIIGRPWRQYWVRSRCRRGGDRGTILVCSDVF